MPKLKTKQTKANKKCRNVWGNIEKYCIINSIDRTELANILQLSKNSITNRKNAPENLSLGEMLRFCDVVNINIEDLFK